MQYSGWSQVPAAERQTEDEDLNVSDGQSVLVGEQSSAVSQIPADARQVIVAATAALRGPHVPSALAPFATEQAMQSVGIPPPHSVSQQTPSTQKPL